MKDAAKLVAYELRRFEWAAGTVLRDRGAYSATGTGGMSDQEASVVEVLLLHARNLRDFLQRPRSDLKKWEETDVVAEDFFDDLAACPVPAFDYLLVENSERLNRALSHLSYDRLRYADDGATWDYPALIGEVRDAWREFLAALPDGRAEWFPR